MSTGPPLDIKEDMLSFAPLSIDSYVSFSVFHMVGVNLDKTVMNFVAELILDDLS